MSGEMARRINSHDWAATSLGPRAYWPLSLRTAVDLMLSARQPAYVGWGRELISLYNDGYVPIMGNKHPHSLGQPFSVVFAEIWETYQPLLQATLAGDAQHFIDQPFALQGRPGRPMSWFTFSWTPLRDNDGAICGFYCAATETTDKMLAERTLREQSSQFRTLVDQAPIGIYLIDADFTMRHVNPIASPTFGAIPNLIGRDFAEVLQILWPSAFAAELTTAFKQVLATGTPLIVPERAERRADTNELEYYNYRVDRSDMPDGRYGVVCYFREVTDQVMARQTLAESKQRQEFLLQLSDMLRPMQDASRILAAATRLIAQHLKVSRAYCFELDYATGQGIIVDDYFVDGDASVAGAYDAGTFGNIVDNARQQRILAIADVNTDPTVSAAERAALAHVNIRAKALAALLKLGKLVALFNVAHCAPRTWTALELSLIQETAERTWAAVERAHAEASLRRSEELYRAFVELNPQISWTASPDGRVTRLSQRWAQLTGISSDDIYSGGWLRVVHVGDAAPMQNLWSHSLRTGEAFDQEMRILTRSNVYHWARVRAYPQLDADDTVLQWFGTVEDVEDRHAAALALRASERRLQTLIEGVPQLVWRAVDHGRWTWSSPQWTEFTGQTEMDSRGHGWLQSVHPDDRQVARFAWTAAVEGAGAVFDAEFRLMHVKEQRYRWFQSRATPVRNERGEVIEWLGTSTDVDDLRQMQSRQEVLVAELQHRTRNLMAVVRSTAERTMRSSEGMGDFEDKFRERMAALSRVQGLLSRLKDGKRIMFDELLRSELAAHGVSEEASTRVLLRGPAGVPLRSSTVQTFAMALHELATNATKYGALRQPQGRLEVHWRLEQASADAPPWLHVDWRERQVVMSATGSPLGTGHGRELIERALPYQLGARTRFSLEPDGVHCAIALPISQRSAFDEVETP